MNELNPPAIVQEANISTSIFQLQNIIERYATRLKEIKDNKKLLSEQEKSIFDNDSELSEAEEEAQVLISRVKERKAKLKSTIELTNLKVKKADLIEEQKEIEETISNHLLNYYSLTNSKSFDTSNGEQVSFKTKAAFTSKQLSLF